MKNIIEADQDKPFNLMKNKLLHGKEYKELLAIVKSNRPDLTNEEIIEMFKKLANTGCSCAALANMIYEQFFTNDEEFKKMFGFSLFLNGTNKINCNKLMVDIYSRLYNIAKVKFIEYDLYYYSSCIKAAEELIGLTCNNESDASLALFNSGFILDGEEFGKIRLKSRQPNVSQYIGSSYVIAKNKFGIEGIKNFADLKQICQQKNIDFEYKDLEINEKFTTLLPNAFNFWNAYYFNTHNINYCMLAESINSRDFIDYAEFQKHLVKLIQEGYSVSVSSNINSNVYIHTKKMFSYIRIDNERFGHIMIIKGFNSNGDIIVSSYGEEYILSKEYFNNLSFRKYKKIEMSKEFEKEKDNREINDMKR